MSMCKYVANCFHSEVKFERGGESANILPKEYSAIQIAADLSELLLKSNLNKLQSILLQVV